MAELNECEGYSTTDRSSIYVLLCSQFLWWVFHLCLEKYCNMGPVIRRTASLKEIEDHVESVEQRKEKKAAKEDHLADIIGNLGSNVKLEDLSDHEQKDEEEPQKSDSKVVQLKDVKDTNLKPKGKLKPTKSKNMLMKLTKSIDNENQYRIKTRASILFTKCLFRCILLSMAFIGALAMDTSFIRKHFWDLDHCTTYFLPLQYASALILSYYLWEIAMLASYASVDAAVYIHHWFTIVAACNIIYGLYSPLATNYGMFMVAFNPITDFGTAIRFQYACDYPDFTQGILRFGSFYFATMLLCGWAGSVTIIVRCFWLGLANHHVSLWSIILYVCAMIGWGYDDIHLIQTFYGWSHEDYRHAVFDMDYLKRLASGRVSQIKKVSDFNMWE